MAYSDRELLARLIQCEAGGEGEDGMKAVAGVVMNRVHAKGGEYARVGQGSIRNIIFQPYQFVCASETEGGAYNPQLGSAVALVMMLVVVVCMTVMNRFGEGEEQAVML